MLSPTLISDLRSTSKPKEKQQILKENDCTFLRYILKSSYEPFDVYHVKVKKSDIPEPGEHDVKEKEVTCEIESLIDYCRHSNSNKKNRSKVVNFLQHVTRDTQDLVIGILHKNWRCGFSVGSIEKVFPGLVTRFEVQLANSYPKVIKKKTYKKKDRWCSFKLDGIRGVALRLIEGWKFFSRQGKEFLTIDHIKPQLEALYKSTGKTFWDGELYIPKAEFEVIQGAVMRFTAGTCEDIEYRVFICGDKDDFLNCNHNASSFEIVTQQHLHAYVAPKVVEAYQWLITEEQIPTELERAFELGHEGIMLRDPIKLYEMKRSDALLKLKENDSDESQELISDCLVVSVEEDLFPVYVDEFDNIIFDDISKYKNKKLVYKTLLVRLKVEQMDGIICSIGSGFTLKFRVEVSSNPECILNKVIEAKHQRYGSKGKMRFPRISRIREDLTWGKHE